MVSAAPVSMTSGLIVAALTILALQKDVPRPQLGLWMATMIGVVGYRLWRCLLVRGDLAREANADSFFARITIATSLLAILWLVPALLWFDHASAESRLFIMLTYVGMMSGGSRALGLIPSAAMAFVIIVGAGLLRITIIHGGWIMTSLTILLMIVQCQSIRSSARLFSAHVRGRRELEEQGQLMKLLREFHSSGSHWMWETDAELRVRYVSRAMAEALGAAPKVLLGQDFRRILDPDGQSRIVSEGLSALCGHIERSESFYEIAFPALCGTRWFCLSGRPALDDHGALIGWRGVGSDITGVRVGAGTEGTRVARRDPLTGLANRLMVREMLEEARLRQRAGEGDCTLLLLDLDRFKLVNDTLGHAVGDRLLVEVAARLEEVCGAEAGVGRLGGDEFAVVWRGASDSLTLLNLAERIAEAVEQGFKIGPSPIRVGVSIGIALAPRDGETHDELMRSADLALYRAKDTKRGHHSFYEPWMLAKASAERLLENDVREAVGRGDLELHYQPIVDAGTRRTVGQEALLRWSHPQRGPIGPEVFVPIIEDAGLIHLIGDWIIREACREAAGWPDEQRIAVNISVSQLTGADLRKTVEQALAESGLAPERLELEVTESIFLGEDGTTLGALAGLQNLGVRLVLDDFGKGYSSLAYLSRACFAKIKIDQQFIRGAASGQRDYMAIVQSILALAKGLGIETTAEGVETAAQAQLMTQLGCSQLQGFLFGKPVEADRIVHAGEGAWPARLRRRA